MKYEKVLYIGDIIETDGENLPVFVEVVAEMSGIYPREKIEKFSMHGVVAPMRNGDAKGSCGQIQDEIRDVVFDKSIKYAEGWDEVKTMRLLQIWDEYHLNDLQAGCEHQRAEQWEDVRIPAEELPNSHANRDEKGFFAIWIYPAETGKDDSHEKGLLTKACKVCGYKYGSSWLRKDVPMKVLDDVKAFPEASKVPAWV